MSRLSPINKIDLKGRWERLPTTSVPNNIDLKKHQEHGEGTVWLADKGLWYDYKSQFYFDPQQYLWYDPRSRLWNQPGEGDWFELKPDGQVPAFSERDPVCETIYVDEEGNFENADGNLVYVNPYGYYQHFEGSAIEQYRMEFRHAAASPRNEALFAELSGEVPEVEKIYVYEDRATGEVCYVTENGLTVEPMGSGKYKLAVDGREIPRPIIVKNEIPECIKNPPPEKGFFDMDSDEEAAALAGEEEAPPKSPAPETSGAGSPASSTAKAAKEVKPKDRRRAPERAYSPEAYQAQDEHEETLHQKYLDTLKTPVLGSVDRPVGRALPDTLEDIIKHMQKGDLEKFAEDDEISEMFRRANLPAQHFPVRRPPAQKPIKVYDHNRPEVGDPRQSRPPCMNFYAGKCRRGDFCYWRHDMDPKRKGKPAPENKVFFDMLDCPKKHGVTLIKAFARKGYVCDVCEKEIDLYSNVYQCRVDRCKFDCCPRCANGAREIRCIGVRDMSLEQYEAEKERDEKAPGGALFYPESTGRESSASASEFDEIDREASRLLCLPAGDGMGIV